MVATVDFAFSTKYGLLYRVKLFVDRPISSHSFDSRVFKVKTKFLYGVVNMDCAFDDALTIVVTMVDFVISANLVFYIAKVLKQPVSHDHIP